MTVFITKHALTGGIEEAEADPVAGMCVVKGRGLDQYFHGECREWHRTRESAVTRAYDMRRRKIESLRKQIERLEGLEF